MSEAETLARLLSVLQQAKDGHRFWLLVCRDCSPALDVVMPFGSAAERGGWAAEHATGAGHRDRLVIDPT